MRVDSPRPSPHNGICPNGKEGKMIALFEKGAADRGTPIAINSDYVIRVIPAYDPYEAVIVCDLGSSPSATSLVTVKGTIQEVVAKLNGAR